MKRGKYKVDLTGKRFGMLVVESFLGIHEKRLCAIWRCKCDCGNTHDATISMLKIGHVTSCGCKHNRKQADSPRWQGVGDLSGFFWTMLLRNAAARNWKVFITKDFLWTLFLKQDKKCAYTGDILSFGKNNKDNINKTASVDRIDPTKDYTEDNVEWVHKDINIMKQGMTKEQFIEVCCKIADYSRNKKADVESHASGSDEP